jgi:hypothetical protein
VQGWGQVLQTKPERNCFPFFVKEAGSQMSVLVYYFFLFRLLYLCLTGNFLYELLGLDIFLHWKTQHAAFTDKAEVQVH